LSLIRSTDFNSELFETCVEEVAGMQMSLKVQQVSSLSKGMVKLLLVRYGIKARIQPIPKNEEQKMVQDLLVRYGIKARIQPIPKNEEQKMVQDVVTRVQSAFEDSFPGGIIVGGPSPMGKKWDAVIDMQITQEEYDQLGRPSIGDRINIEVNKVEKEED
jgi:hypothetical protein